MKNHRSLKYRAEDTRWCNYVKYIDRTDHPFSSSKRWSLNTFGNLLSTKEELIYISIAGVLLRDLECYILVEGNVLLVGTVT